LPLGCQRCSLCRGGAIEIQHAVLEVVLQQPGKSCLEGALALAFGEQGQTERVSKKVMVVIQTDSAGWRSSHPTTSASGALRINAESTLVSRMITFRSLPTVAVDRAIRGGLPSARCS
jgi:hypothetical protein